MLELTFKIGNTGVAGPEFRAIERKLLHEEIYLLACVGNRALA
jgi:hypothetical protein